MTERAVRVKNNTRARSLGFVTDRNGGNADVGGKVKTEHDELVGEADGGK